MCSILCCWKAIQQNCGRTGFIVNDYNTSPKIVAYGLPKWFDCLGSAFGLGRDGFSAYINGTKQLMTARAGLAIAKALAKRTLGMIGVAIAVYEYYDCMRWYRDKL